MFVNITEDDRGQPFEVFVTLGKAGGSAMADAEAMGRLISLALRSGIPLMEIHRQLRGISSDRAVGLGPNKVLSVPDAIGIALEEWWRDKQGVQQELLADQTPVHRRLACPRVEQVTVSGHARESDPDDVRVRERRRQRIVHRHVPRLRLAARVRGGMREVPRVRVQRVRVK